MAGCTLVRKPNGQSLCELEFYTKMPICKVDGVKDMQKFYNKFIHTAKSKSEIHQFTIFRRTS